MASNIQRNAVILALWSLATVMQAQTPPPSPASTTPDEDISTPASLAAPLPPKRVSASPNSDQVSSAITAGITYQPPKPKPARTKPEVDQRDIDKPRNGIVRLPKYTVEGERPAIFAERNLYTAKGLADLAAQRHLSSFDRNFLNKYDVFGYSKERAMQMYRDDERQKNMADTNDKIYMLRQTGSSDEADRLKQDSYDSYYRPAPAGLTTDSDVTTPSYLRR